MEKTLAAAPWKLHRDTAASAGKAASANAASAVIPACDAFRRRWHLPVLTVLAHCPQAACACLSKRREVLLRKLAAPGEGDDMEKLKSGG